jgi:hypothetical protein
MFDPSRSGIDLPVFALLDGDHVALLIEYHKTCARRSLVNRRNIVSHAHLLVTILQESAPKGEMWRVLALKRVYFFPRVPPVTAEICARVGPKSLVPQEWIVRISKWAFFIILGLLAACSGGGSPSETIERYLQSLVDGDQIQAVNASCAEWEGQARAEAASFEAVEARLEEVVCTAADGGGESTTVTCGGAILATYGAEEQQLTLQGRVYEVVREGGEWRMCGYQ